MLTPAIHRIILLEALTYALLTDPRMFLTNELARVAAIVILGDLLYWAIGVWRSSKPPKQPGAVPAEVTQ